MARDDLITGEDGVTRCWWCVGDELLRDYHDTEWGMPVADDDPLFERLSLEGFQCGLSWLTILRRRPRFREVFHGFDIQRVAKMGERDVERLATDTGIIRHRGKIRSTIENARRAIELAEEFGSLTRFLWSYAPQADAVPPRRDRSAIPVKTAESERLSRDLKRRGWTFVGPTTMYAMMQAVGMVDDHLAGCHRRAELAGTERPAIR